MTDNRSGIRQFCEASAIVTRSAQMAMSVEPRHDRRRRQPFIPWSDKNSISKSFAVTAAGAIVCPLGIPTSPTAIGAMRGVIGEAG
jgi:hypothetical protein